MRQPADFDTQNSLFYNTNWFEAGAPHCSCCVGPLDFLQVACKYDNQVLCGIITSNKRRQWYRAQKEFLLGFYYKFKIALDRVDWWWWGVLDYWRPTDVNRKVTFHHPNSHPRLALAPLCRKQLHFHAASLGWTTFGEHFPFWHTDSKWKKKSFELCWCEIRYWIKLLTSTTSPLSQGRDRSLDTKDEAEDDSLSVFV